MPTPVLHVGEVHAELRLSITDETLHDLGSQIGSMIANAARQGFDAGMAAALAGMDDDLAGDVAGAAARTKQTMTEEDLRRARGE